MRVLIVKTSSMGDVLHCLPALTDVQQAIPNIQFDWVVEEAFAEIPRWHGAVNQVIPVEIRRWRKQLLNGKTWQQWKQYRQLLQQNQYDAVIDAQGLIKSAFLVTRLAKGKKHGYDRHCAREPLAAYFYDQTYHIPYQQHAVERIRQLFAQSLGYSLPDMQGDYGIAHCFASDEPNAAPYMLFIHATTRADKHWLDEEWVRLAQKLTELSHDGLQIRLPWGNEKERQRAEWIASQVQSAVKNVIVLPKLTLTELAQQIAQAKAVVSVDTGLAHLTAALDVPNVTLYGATDPKLIGCYGKQQMYLSASGMNHIQHEQVLDLLSSYGQI